MPNHSRASLLVLLFLSAATVYAQTDMSGSYTGTYHLTVGSGACTATSSGPLMLSISQTGTTADLAGVAQNATVITSQSPCSSTVTNIPIQASGTVSNNVFSGTANGVSISAVLSGNTLNGTFINSSGGGVAFSGTFSATRGGGVSTFDFSGTWTGSLTGDLACSGGGTPIPATATLQQNGSAVTGSIVISGGVCTGGTTTTIPVNAMLIEDDLFLGEFDFPGATDGAVAGVIAGAGLMGIGIAFTDSAGEDVSLFGLFTGGNGPQLPLAITSFVASPPTIRAGQTTTLSWSVQGATGVSIDNGVGHVASFGSLAVAPKTTTTYELSATNGSTTESSTVTVTVLTGPIINVTSLPSPMLQLAGTGGATTSYALTNSGSDPTTITLTQNGNFFTQSPATFTLAAGATQVITITGTAQSAGSYEGASIPTGNGVPSGLQVPVKLLSAPPPAGAVAATPAAPRVDVAAPPNSTPSGTVSFTNKGNATLTGILSADVPWIVPQAGVVTIAPGATATFTFTIDRSKRPDSAGPIGSLEGNIILSFLGGNGPSFAKGPFDSTPAVPSVSLVKVVDTAQPTVTTAGIPALATGEVALFVAGAGHVTGTTGQQFVSDINVLNPQGSRAVDDLKMYYTPITGSASSAKATSIPPVAGQVSVAVADVVKNVFNGSSNELGTVQIRSKDADKLAVAATVLTPNNPNGIFGNTIPVFRSDRSAEGSGTLVLTGLRRDATTHTNLYVQETSGADANVQIDFLGADGSTISSRTEKVDAFKLVAVNNAVPAGAVAAVLTNTSTGGGKIAAYATPVDEASSDTWAIADWSKQYGYAPSDAVVIPVAGSVHGANNTFYRTDVAITNRGTAQGSGKLHYVSRNGSTADATITLGAKQTNVVNDVVGSLLKVAGDSIGYLTFTPASGSSFAVSSRTFTSGTAGSEAATFGTGVPALAASSALRQGSARPIAGLADASRSTVVASRPGTFRTNFALMETSGRPVTVRVTFRFTFPAGAKAQGIGAASRDYALNGGSFLLLNSISGEILGPARLQFGDLSNVEADFQVIEGIGSVMLFTSSVDNKTGDSILRTE